MVAKTSAGLLQYATSMIGNPYAMGTRGEILTEEFLKRLISRNPLKWYTPKRIAFLKTQYGRRVHDCAGLIEAYINDTDGNGTYDSGEGNYDTTANSMIDNCKEKGPIATMPHVPGVLVGYNGHIMIYKGDGYVVEARGANYGVCSSKLSSRGATKWGIHDKISLEPVLIRRILKVTKKHMSGDDVWCIQDALIHLGYNCGTSGSDGEYGQNTASAVSKFQRNSKITVDGKVGPITISKLIKALTVIKYPIYFK